MASIPEDLKYTKDHEWARQREAVVVVGLTDHAQRQLGDVVYVELPSVGDRVEVGEPFGTVESVKAVSEIYAPVAGQITKVNEGLSASPEDINTEPYGNGWLVEIQMANASPVTELLTANEYSAYIDEETGG
ncbi:MAG: glycine cleavage system protein GcvH [Actinomycetota bacterium]|jgi:glycine cleavage system H protein|nr:glycine cleavage system protein GcvH [Actinomycetota bacterium]